MVFISLILCHGFRWNSKWKTHAAIVVDNKNLTWKRHSLTMSEKKPFLLFNMYMKKRPMECKHVFSSDWIIIRTIFIPQSSIFDIAIIQLTFNFQFVSRFTFNFQCDLSHHWYEIDTEFFFQFFHFFPSSDNNRSIYVLCGQAINRSCQANNNK